MKYSSDTIEKAIEVFSSFPSIGRKTAQRLTYFLLRQNEDFAYNMASAIVDLKKKIKFCSICFNYTETDPCPICSSYNRDQTIICVVEEPNDVVSIEKTNDYFGLYHVLHGVMNPLEGITQDDIKIVELISRLSNIREVILALNPSVEGELTTHYLAKLIKPFDIKVSRIASGLPMGSSLEFSDDATIARAIEGRIQI